MIECTSFLLQMDRQKTYKCQGVIAYNIALILSGWGRLGGGGGGGGERGDKNVSGVK